MRIMVSFARLHGPRPLEGNLEFPIAAVIIDHGQLVPGRKLHFLQMHPVRPACLRSIGIEAKLIPFTLIVQTEHVITPRVKDHHDRVRQLGQSRLGRNIDIPPNLILHLLHSHVERIKFCHKMHLQIQEWDTKTETASPAELITAKKPGLKPPDHHRSS